MKVEVCMRSIPLSSIALQWSVEALEIGLLVLYKQFILKFMTFIVM